MSNAIFHIGFHKTGTTWFQRNFYPNVSGIRYVEREQLQRHFIAPTAFGFDADRVRSHYEGDARYLFCDEELSGNIHNGGLNGCLTKEIALRIHAVFPDATIVLFLREQVSMVASIYAQYVKKGGTYRPGRYLFHPEMRNNRFPLFQFDHLLYDRLIRYYRGLFGSERVKVYLFEDFAQDFDAFVQNYLEALKLEKDVERFEREKANPAYGSLVLPLARFCNAFTSRDVLNKYYVVHLPGWYLASVYGLEAMNRITRFNSKISNARLLGSDIAEYVRNYYRESNSNLVSEFGLDVERHGYSVMGRSDRGSRRRERGDTSTGAADY